jgi:NAD(P)-dependent dehydrogenase (short-subunit alcohol dehydrogenase family)
MMMKNLALEWGHYGIRANSIVPGPIDGTEGMKRLSNAGARATLLESVPMRRVGSVDDIGQTAVFLASPLASYISGCVVVCDGGSNLAGSGRFNATAETILREQGKL